MSSMCWAHLGNCAHWNLELFGIARSAIFAGVLSEADALGRGSKFKAKKRTRNRLSIDRLVFGNGILGTPLLTKTHYRIRSNRARIRTLEMEAEVGCGQSLGGWIPIIAIGPPMHHNCTQPDSQTELWAFHFSKDESRSRKLAATFDSHAVEDESLARAAEVVGRAVATMSLGRESGVDSGHC